MKDQIFIGWSGTNNVALEIKKRLEAKNYRCYIGGNADNSSQFSSVGDTVIQQIKNCNQAIMIFQNRNDGQVSGNLFFELGYVLAMYGQQKVHCVKKRRETVVLPSDFDNSFVEPVDCDNDGMFADGIIKYFEQRQKMSVNTNKMFLINNRYKMRDYLQSHFSEHGSKCSDYELAQYVLFYMQAAHMFGDENSVLAEIRDFKRDHSLACSDELCLAVDVAIAFLEMVTQIKVTDGGEMFIERSVFKQLRDKYREYRSALNEKEAGAFEYWCKVFISEHASYAYGLYAMQPALNEEKRRENMEKSKIWAEQTIRDIEEIEEVLPIKEYNDQKGLLALFRAYVYRNIYLSCRFLQDRKQELEYLEKTKRVRTALKNAFEPGSIDSKLYDNFSMEYYLTLAEYLHHAEEFSMDEDDVEDYKEEIRTYIEETKRKSEHSKYVERIALLVESI